MDGGRGLRALIVGLAVLLLACLAVLLVGVRLLGKLATHVPPVALQWIRRILALVVVVTGTVIALDILRVIAIPPVVITLYSLIFPVFVGLLLSGLVSPLAPGALIILFRRYRIGDLIVIGHPSSPLARGRVTTLDLYQTVVQNDPYDGGHTSVANAIVSGQSVTRLPPA